MIELYNAFKFITMLCSIRKILKFNLVVAFSKSMSTGTGTPNHPDCLFHLQLYRNTLTKIIFHFKRKGFARLTFFNKFNEKWWSGFLDMVLCIFLDDCLWWPPFCKPCHVIKLNQRTNGPVNAHLIAGPSISTKHTKSGEKKNEVKK